MHSKVAKTVTAALAILALAACSTSTDEDLMPVPDEGEVLDEGMIPVSPTAEIDEDLMPVPDDSELVPIPAPEAE